MMNIVNIAGASEIKNACFNVEGMTCSACTVTTKSAINKLDGIKNIQVSLEKKNAIISYDSAITNSKEIKSKIDSIGYMASEVQCTN
jgi:copper chaperone CopZ